MRLMVTSAFVLSSAILPAFPVRGRTRLSPQYPAHPAEEVFRGDQARFRLARRRATACAAAAAAAAFPGAVRLPSQVKAGGHGNQDHEVGLNHAWASLAIVPIPARRDTPPGTAGGRGTTLGRRPGAGSPPQRRPAPRFGTEPAPVASALRGTAAAPS